MSSLPVTVILASAQKTERQWTKKAQTKPRMNIYRYTELYTLRKGAIERRTWFYIGRAKKPRGLQPHK
jgi:hypothetical protein